VALALRLEIPAPAVFPKRTMPLLDYFHPPLSNERRWESFHSSWATRIAADLTERWLPPNYIAEEHVHLGPSVEIDVATFVCDSPLPCIELTRRIRFGRVNFVKIAVATKRT
jgi:hypothetical protein